MEERLENFVNLLNQQRKARPVPQELAKLPNWAQRELLKQSAVNGAAKVEANGVAAKPEAAVNGKNHDAAPKPEIVVAAKIEAKKVEPPKPIEAKAPPVVEARGTPPKPETKAPVTLPMSAADKVRDPQSLLAKFLAEETARPERPKAPVVIDAKAEAAEPAPSFSDKLADKLAQKFAQPSVAIAPPTDKPAVEKKPDDKEKIEPRAPQIGAKSDKVASQLTDGAEIVPMQPIIAEALASPRAGGRPMAYALAAAAVIAAIAVVVGAYWYTRNGAPEIATVKTIGPSVTVAKQSPPPNTAKPPVVAEKPKPPTPAPAPKIVEAKPKPVAVPAPPAVAKIKPATPAPTMAQAPAPKQDATPDAKPEIKIATAPAAPTPTPAAKPSVAEGKPELKPASAPAPVPVKPVAPTVAATMPALTPPVISPAPPPSAQLAMLTPPPPSPVAALEPETKPAPPPAAMPAKPAATKPASPAPTKQVASADEPTWRRYAVAAPPFSGQPQIAIVIDDLGLDKDRTTRAVALAGPVTLSFLAYASDLAKQTEAARHAGHELIVHVPMEPVVRPKFVSSNAGASNPAAQAELLRRLRWDLGRFTGYVGVNNHLGNRLSSDPDSTHTVIAELKARGLLFLDSRPGGAVLAVAAEQGVPTVTRDVLLDDDVAATSVKERLAKVEKVARERGTAIAIGHPHDQTLEALQTWIAELPSKGLQLVPLTAIVKNREQHVAGTN